MLRIFKFLKPYVLQIILIIGLTYLQVMCDLQLPDFMSKIVNEGIVMSNMDIVVDTGIRMLLVALLSALCTVVVAFFASRTATKYSMDLREMLFKKVQSFSLAELDQFSTASLITRTTNDIQQVQMALVMILRMVVMAPIMGVGAITKALGQNAQMSWVIIVAVIALAALIVLIFLTTMPKFNRMQGLMDRLNQVTREQLTGIRVIRAFDEQEYEEERFDKANKELTGVHLFVNRAMSLMMPGMMLIMNFTSLVCIWLGAALIGEGTLEIGNMIAFMQYSMQVIMAALMISVIFIMIPRASVSAKRINEVLETPITIKDSDSPAQATRKNGKVEFNNVTFSYPGATSAVIDNVSFVANPGETTAIIGSTGCGKTTLINLIPRFYDVTKGEIKVDDVDVRSLSQSDLHEKVGYVPQKGTLFSGTVSSNINYGVENPTDENTQDAARTAQAMEFIEHMDKKFDAKIDQGGLNVSGGQKQRLSIARALAKNPEIYIFDDSFSALDFKTDAQLRQALAGRTQNASVIIVAQRINTIMNADKILVMDKGKIVGMGKHKELLRSCPVYKEIAMSQLSEEELA